MSMNNMEIFDLVKDVPSYAKKSIQDGRLKGKTDISPMWRIQALTEVFGPCGFGWKYEIVSQRMEPGADGVIKAFVDINLYVKWGDKWSEPIPGIGGNDFVAKETRGLYTSDECYKKALSDAISVAAKALGFGASVYMGSEDSKYTRQPQEVPAPARQAPPPAPQALPEPVAGPDGYYNCAACNAIIGRQTLKDGQVLSPHDVAVMALRRTGRQLCASCLKAALT